MFLLKHSLPRRHRFPIDLNNDAQKRALCACPRKNPLFLKIIGVGLVTHPTNRLANSALISIREKTTPFKFRQYLEIVILITHSLDLTASAIAPLFVRTILAP